MVSIVKQTVWMSDGAVFETPAAPQPDPVQLDPNQPWGYLPHDFELKEFIGFSIWTDENTNRDGRTRWYPKQHGDPETVVTYLKESRVVMTPEWQWFAFRQFVLSCYGHTDETRIPALELSLLKTAWGSVMQGNRVITNNTGWDDGYQDVIQGVNKGAPYFRYMPLCMGGNVVKLVDTNKRRPNAQFGESYLIETLDGLKPPPDPDEVNFITHPWLFSRATVARYARPEDNISLETPWSHVIPFPQLDGWNAHVPLLNISNGGRNYVQTARCAIWKNLEIPNPYNPALVKAHG